MTGNQQLYDRDFYAGANEQAELLRSGRLSEADIENIAEEIESLGKREKRELASRLAVPLLHLLKWRYQAVLRSRSRALAIDERRNQLEDNPSLKGRLGERIAGAYRNAVPGAARETGIEPGELPGACPWPIEQVLDRNFLPEVTN